MKNVTEMENDAEVESSGTEEDEFGRGTIRRNHPQIIAKRKRTKRRRLSGINIVSNSISSTDIGVEKDRNYESSVTTTTTMTTTEEEEDMANCLILLARSGSRRLSFSNENDEVNFNKSLAKETTEIKKTISSFSLSSLIPNGVDGNVLYECKTCDKAFQSFQALGGHRASHHKKAKSLFPDDTTTVANSRIKVPSIAKTSAILRVKKESSSAHNSSVKLHECAICGSAFSSGQALGGHMRRHRATATATVVTAAAAVDAELAQIENVAVLVSDKYIGNDESDNNNNNKFLASLDLNMPAPAEEDQDEDVQMSHSQRRRLYAANVQASVNPSTTTAPPSLVGCYF